MPNAYAAVYLRRTDAAWPVDMGDDPSFEWAGETGEPLTWGVCRPNLRNALAKEDLVTFLAADRLQDRRPARYAWIGYATVAEKISQAAIFQRPAYERYRTASNLLIRPSENGAFEHFEPNAPRGSWHGDWLWRLVKTKCMKEDFEAIHASNAYDPLTSRAAGGLISLHDNYIIFSAAPDLTWFADDPPEIAYGDSIGATETWLENELAAELRAAIFENASRTSLRTTNQQTPHPHLRFERPADEVRALLANLTQKYRLRARPALTRLRPARPQA